MHILVIDAVILLHDVARILPYMYHFFAYVDLHVRVLLRAKL